jgi:hypothetical protein
MFVSAAAADHETLSGNSDRWELVYNKPVQIHEHCAILREKLKNWLLQETHHISTFFFLEEIQVQ